MKAKLKLIILVLFSLSISAHAQQKERKKLDNRVNLLLGLTQVTLGGFNIEGNVFYKRMVFDYSHGISLDFPNSQLEEGPDKSQDLSIHIPWTTGFGVGYRFTEWLNLRLEPKWHRFEVYYDGQEQTSENLIVGYNTFTLGLGLYTNFLPFKKQTNFLKGIMIAPNVRWWPKLSSTLENNSYEYYNIYTEQTETHNAREIGIANTPFIFNISIGYSVKF